MENDGFDKDVEIQSTHPSCLSSDHCREGRVKEEMDVEKGDERAEDIAIESMREEDRGGEKVQGLKDILSRVSTRASCKDHGPPPDGGWSGWSQGVFSSFS